MNLKTTNRHKGCTGIGCPHCANYVKYLTVDPEGAARMMAALGYVPKRTADPNKPRTNLGVPP